MPKGEKIRKNDHNLSGIQPPQAFVWQQHCIMEHHNNRCSEKCHGHQGKARIYLEYIQNRYLE